MGERLEPVAARREVAGHEVVRAGAAAIGPAVQGAAVVLTHLEGEAAVRRVYAEPARTATPGQVFAALTEVPAATRAWCALVVPAYLALARRGRRLSVRGDGAHLAHAEPVLRHVGGPVDHAGDLQEGRTRRRPGT